jgi:monoamine oxidase
LSSPVRNIQQTGEGVYVTAGRGDYLAQRVIVSVPTPIYEEITFDPPLPKAKQELSSKTILGTTIKVILLYNSPWWRAGNLTGIVQSFKGPVVVARDTSVDERKQFSITCFVVAAPGRAWAKIPQPERLAMIHDQIKTLYGPFVESVPQPIETVEMNWDKEQWSQGCPCPAMPPGVMTSFGHALRTPHGRVHFVGTETAYEWKGYMEGAARSGERGAKEVIQHFNQPKL